MRIVEGAWPGRFTCGQCQQPSYLVAFVIMGEAQVCWECICLAAAEAESKRPGGARTPGGDTDPVLA